MIDAVQNGMLTLMDFLLGWMLRLPLGVSLAIVAVGTAAILTFIRPLVTNQKTLQRCKRDKKRLQELMKEAKARKDADALARHRSTIGQIAMHNMRAEFWPLVVSLIPIALLCVWSFARLGYVPAKADQPIEVKATFDAKAQHKVAYIIPQAGISADNGWIQRVADASEQGASAKNAAVTETAVWKIRAQARPEPYRLTIRCGDETSTKELLVDGRRYAPVVELYPNQSLQAVQLLHEQYRPWGFVPGIPFLHLDPWIVGYLLIAMPLAFLLRYLFNVC